MAQSLLALCALLVGAFASGEERFTSLDHVRKIVDENGRVTDKNIETVTGWTAIRAFTWSIELATSENDRFAPVPADRDFRDGERFRLRMSVASPLYCYVLVHNADNSYDVLLPDKESRVPRLEAGKDQLLPEKGAFKFTPPAGTEELWLVASPKALPFIAPREIWDFARKVQEGGELDKEEQAALANLKAVRAKTLGGAAEATQAMSVKKGLDQVIAEIRQGVRARGVELVSTAPQADVQLVVHGAARPDPNTVIIEKIVLRHR